MLRHSLPAVPCTHASGRAVTLRGVRQHQQAGRSAVDIDAELNAAPRMPSVTRASCMTNVAANCSQRHRSADGYQMHVHMQDQTACRDQIYLNSRAAIWTPM